MNLEQRDSGGAKWGENVKSFLKGRSFPGTIKLSRKDRKPTSSSQAGSNDAADAEHALPKSRSPSQESLGVSTSSQDVSDSGHLTSPSNPVSTPKGSAATPPPASPSAPSSPVRPSAYRSMSDTRVKKFDKLLGEQVVDLDMLRELAWSGTPSDLRPLCWQLLLGYLPPNRDRREQILARKRREYRDMVPEYYDIASGDRSEEEMGALRQVIVDVPRTAPGVAFFHEAPVQKCLERVLYIWGIRHPASGYVQGINDLVTPFLAALLSQHFDGPMESWDIETLSEESMYAVEADAYWMLCKLLDGIQDHYTNAQPGIQRTVFKLKELVRRIDEPICQHMEAEGLEFLQFSFRWVNCLLLREIPFQLGLRLWDTYLAEGPRMKEFLIYGLAAFLLTWDKELKQMDFQEMVLFLQKLPTTEWDEKDIEMVLSRAYMLRASFNDAQSHLQS
ncbi:hypothetical protein ABBQ38_014820 [Trebouxia sp. C0009 RCD-2024]